MLPEIFGGTWPPILPVAMPPVERWRCAHFTTLDGATLNAAATTLMLSPEASRAKARSRKSIERGCAMPESFRFDRAIESETQASGNPPSIQLNVTPL